MFGTLWLRKSCAKFVYEESVTLLLWSAMATAGIVWKNWDAVHNPCPLKLCQMSGKLQKNCGSTVSVVVAVVCFLGRGMSVAF